MVNGDEPQCGPDRDVECDQYDLSRETFGGPGGGVSLALPGNKQRGDRMG